MVEQEAGGAVPTTGKWTKGIEENSNNKAVKPVRKACFEMII